MIPLFDDVAVLHHDDEIGVADRREPVGDDEARPVPAQGGHGLLHEPLGRAAGVLGGVTTALYGLIGIIGVRMWVDGKVDFSKPKNQFTAGVALVVGIAAAIDYRSYGTEKA